MEKMRKQELVKRWKQLDKACEAVERLNENDTGNDGYLLMELVALKNKVEEIIETKTRVAT